MNKRWAWSAAGFGLTLVALSAVGLGAAGMALRVLRVHDLDQIGRIALWGSWLPAVGAVAALYRALDLETGGFFRALLAVLVFAGMFLVSGLSVAVPGALFLSQTPAGKRLLSEEPAFEARLRRFLSKSDEQQ